MVWARGGGEMGEQWVNSAKTELGGGRLPQANLFKYTIHLSEVSTFIEFGLSFIKVQWRGTRVRRFLYQRGIYELLSKKREKNILLEEGCQKKNWFSGSVWESKYVPFTLNCCIGLWNVQLFDKNDLTNNWTIAMKGRRWEALEVGKVTAGMGP